MSKSFKVRDLALSVVLMLSLQVAFANCDAIMAGSQQDRDAAFQRDWNRSAPVRTRQFDQLSAAERCLERFAEEAKKMFRTYTFSFDWNAIAEAAANEFNKRACRAIDDAGRPILNQAPQYPNFPQYPGVQARQQEVFSRNPNQRDTPQGDQGWWSSVACRFSGTC